MTDEITFLYELPTGRQLEAVAVFSRSFSLGGPTSETHLESLEIEDCLTKRSMEGLLWRLAPKWLTKIEEAAEEEFRSL